MNYTANLTEERDDLNQSLEEAKKALQREMATRIALESKGQLLQGRKVGRLEDDCSSARDARWTRALATKILYVPVSRTPAAAYFVAVVHFCELGGFLFERKMH